MTADHRDTAVALARLAPQPVLCIRTAAPVAELAAAMDDRLRALRDALRRRGARPAGAPYVRYHTFGATETDVELGLPVADAIPGEGRVAAGTLPGGDAVATWHRGAHDTLREAYARLDAWLAEHGRAPAGAPWEVYAWLDPDAYDGPASLPDPATWRTQLVRPIA